MTALEIADLHVWFEAGERSVHAVQGVSLSLAPGERLGIVGESGCGKSTVLLAALGVLPPSSRVAGAVRRGDVDLLAADEAVARRHRWRDVAMVFQGAMNALNPVQTIERQIVEAMEVHRTHVGATARARAAELLGLVGVPATRGRRYPHELSGGMRQRAVLAMALACEPKVLLADEPTTALDVMVQAQILDLLIRLSEELGLALVLVSHDLSVVVQYCDRAAVMYAGRIVEVSSTERLYREPAHPYTRLLFAATPRLRSGPTGVSIPGAPPRLDRPIAGCPFEERCDRAFELCEHEAPLLTAVGPGHEAACHLHGDVRRRDGRAVTG